MEVMRSPEFGRIMRSLQEKLGQGSVPDSPGRRTPRRSPGGERSSGSFFYSHPKLVKLEEVVVGHFRKLCEQSTSSVRSPGGSVNTRVMIFSQYRESVQEIADMLSQHASLVRVMSFVGHSGKSSSKGLTQKEQTEVRGISVDMTICRHLVSFSGQFFARGLGTLLLSSLLLHVL